MKKDKGAERWRRRISKNEKLRKEEMERFAREMDYMANNPLSILCTIIKDEEVKYEE